MAKNHFKAESTRLLDLMINSIYTNKDIFLREIISNASDASDKMRFISLTDESARSQMSEMSIRVSFDKDARTITVSDHGIGMTAEELESNLGTICKSGSLQFKENMSKEEEKEAINIIGQFGVGFYSAFMVADKLTVISRSYQDSQAFRWESKGADGYTVTPCDKENVGTDVILHIKDDTENDKYSDYLSQYRLKNLIKTYSDYIHFPIIMQVEKSREVGEGDDKKTESCIEDETVNSMIPVWKKSKSSLKEEETDKYYSDNFYDFEKPLFTVRVSTEGNVSYDSLLFIPAKTPFDYFTKEYEKGLKLYSNGVLIMEKCTDLVPEYFRFVKGVVDTADLSLNISRETLQQDSGLKIIAKNIEKKIKGELIKALNDDREKYEKFWNVFGIQIKYGIVSQYGMFKEQLKDLLMFYSFKEQKLITLEEYIKNMPEEQKNIYYACGETVSKISALPQAELIKTKGYDMLCLTDEVDEFVMNLLHEEEGKHFSSINAENADLLDEKNEKQADEKTEENREILNFLKDSLDIAEVVISKKLITHPVCLSSKGEITLEMEKYFASMPGADAGNIKAQRVLELNAQHRAFKALTDAYKEDKEKAKKIGEVLYAQSMLIAGLPIDDPSGYAEKVCDLL